jgi:predicted enzyme related to lactoylglutathione lyase
MPNVVHFEIPADDPARASKFYTNVFGWQFNKMEGAGMDYWLIRTEEGSQLGGGLARRSDLKTVTNTIGVPSFEEYAKKIESSGGKILTPKTAIPGYGWFAYCLDTEGNMFGIIQGDTNAK